MLFQFIESIGKFKFTVAQSTIVAEPENESIDLDEAVERASLLYNECVKNKVNVIRIGLQTTEEINSKNEDIKGPVCDNY